MFVKMPTILVFYSVKVVRKMTSLQKMKPLVLPPRSVFVGHGFQQHAGAEYLGHVNLRHGVYLSPKDLDLQNCILFAFQ